MADKFEYGLGISAFLDKEKSIKRINQDINDIQSNSGLNKLQLNVTMSDKVTSVVKELSSKLKIEVVASAETKKTISDINKIYNNLNTKLSKLNLNGFSKDIGNLPKKVQDDFNKNPINVKLVLDYKSIGNQSAEVAKQLQSVFNNKALGNSLNTNIIAEKLAVSLTDAINKALNKVNIKKDNIEKIGEDAVTESKKLSDTKSLSKSEKLSQDLEKRFAKVQSEIEKSKSTRIKDLVSAEKEYQKVLDETAGKSDKESKAQRLLAKKKVEDLKEAISYHQRELNLLDKYKQTNIFSDKEKLSSLKNLTSRGKNTDKNELDTSRGNNIYLKGNRLNQDPYIRSFEDMTTGYNVQKELNNTLKSILTQLKNISGKRLSSKNEGANNTSNASSITNNVNTKTPNISIDSVDSYDTLLKNSNSNLSKIKLITNANGDLLGYTQTIKTMVEGVERTLTITRQIKPEFVGSANAIVEMVKNGKNLNSVLKSTFNQFETSNIQIGEDLQKSYNKLISDEINAYKLYKSAETNYQNKVHDEKIKDNLNPNIQAEIKSAEDVRNNQKAIYEDLQKQRIDFENEYQKELGETESLKQKDLEQAKQSIDLIEEENAKINQRKRNEKLNAKYGQVVGGSAKYGESRIDSSMLNSDDFFEGDTNVINIQNASKALEEYYQKQGKIVKNLKIIGGVTKDATGQFSQFNAQFKSTASDGSATIDNVKISINNTTKEVRALNKEIVDGSMFAKSFKEKFKNMFMFNITQAISFAMINKVRQAITEMWQSVFELDSALLELRKVTDLEGEALERFTKRAFEAGQELGRTGIEVANATAVFSRAGYAVEEAFSLSKTALLLTNVADGINDVNEASSSLISIMTGFKMNDAEGAMQIADILNEVSNTQPIDTSNLTTSLKTIAGVANQAGNTLAETTGMITAVFKSLRDQSKTATGLNYVITTLHMLTEDGDEADGTMSKLQATFDRFTNGAVQIKKANGELNSTWDILDALHGQWNNLNSAQQTAIAQAIGGKRQYKAVVALMQNWATAQDAVNSALNSSNSASDENAKYLDSLQGRIANLKSALQSLANTTINSDFIKSIITGTTSIIKFIDSIGGLVPALMPVIGILTILKSATIAEKLVTGTQTFVNNLKLALSAIIPKTSATIADNVAMSTNNVLTDENSSKNIANANAKNVNTIATQGLAGAIGVLSVAIGAVIAVVGVAMMISNSINQKRAEGVRLAKEKIKATKDEADALTRLVKAYKDYKSELQGVNQSEQKFSESKNNLCVQLQKYIDKLKDAKVGTSQWKKLVEETTDEELKIAERKQYEVNAKEQQRLAEKTLSGINQKGNGFGSRLESRYFDGEGKDILSLQYNVGEMAKYFFSNYGNISDKIYKELIKYNEISTDEVKEVMDKYFAKTKYADPTIAPFSGNNFAEQYASMKKIAEAYKRSGNAESKFYLSIQSYLDKTGQDFDEYVNTLADAQKNLYLSQNDMPETSEQIEAMMNDINTSLSQSGVSSALSEYISQAVYNAMQETRDKIEEESKTFHLLDDEELKKMKESISSVASSIKALSDAEKEFAENGTLTAETVQKLIDLGYSSCLSLDAETKKVLLNADAYDELRKKKLEAERNNLINKRDEAIQGVYDSTTAINQGKDTDKVSLEEKTKAVKKYVEELKRQGDLQQQVLSNEDLSKFIDADALVELFDIMIDGCEDAVQSYKDLKDAISDVASEIDSLASAVKEQYENGSVGTETALKLMDEGYAEALEIENGVIKINTERLYDLAKAKIVNQQIDTTSQIEATEKAIKKEADALGIDAEEYKKRAYAIMANKKAEAIGVNKSVTTNTTHTTQMNEIQMPPYWTGTKEEWYEYLQKNKDETVTKTINTQLVVDLNNFNALSKIEDSMLSNLKNDLLSKIDIGGSDAVKKTSEAYSEQQRSLQDALSKIYSAGEMSAQSYLAKLQGIFDDSRFDPLRSLTGEQLAERLTNSEKSVADLAEEFISLKQAIADVKTDIFNKQLEELNKQIKSIDDNLSLLGDIDTMDEMNHEGELLSQKYNLICESIDITKQKLTSLESIIRNTRKDTVEYNTALDEQTRLQEELQDLLEQQIDLKDRAYNIAKDVLEKQKENEELKAELATKEKLLVIEKKLYGDIGKDKYEHLANERIKAIQKEIDALEEKKELQEKTDESLEKQNALYEAQIALQNALNNKTTKVLTKQKDGSWQFEYSADADAVKSARESVESAQKDLDNYLLQQQIDALQALIDVEQKLLDEKNAEYEDAEYHLTSEEEMLKAEIEARYSNMSVLIESKVNELVAEGYNLGEVIKILNNQLANANLDNATLNQTLANIEFALLNGSGLNDEDKAYADVLLTGFKEEQEKNTQSVREGIDGIVAKAEEILNRMALGYDFSQLGLENMTNAVSQGTLNAVTNAYNNGSTFGYVVNIAEVTFPNANNAEEIRNAILSLPRYAKQYSESNNKQGG